MQAKKAESMGSYQGNWGFRGEEGSPEFGGKLEFQHKKEHRKGLHEVPKLEGGN